MNGLRILALAVMVSMLSSVAPKAQNTVMPDPRIQFADVNGVPLSGGFLYTYAAATTTPQQTCADNTRTNATTCVTPNANPIVLDSAGRATVFLLPQSYKFILQNSSASQVWSQDNVTALAPYNQTTYTGTYTFAPPTVLTVTSNAVTPTLNTHALDTSGGAVDLTTLNTTSVTAPFQVTFYANNPGANPVTLKNGGNMVLMSAYLMNTASNSITLLLRGSTWYEIWRSGPSVAIFTVVSKTADYTAAAFDYVVAPSGTFTVSLPAASLNASKQIVVVNNGSGTITVGISGGDTVGLVSSQILNPSGTAAQGDAMTLTSDGVSNWSIS